MSRRTRKTPSVGAIVRARHPGRNARGKVTAVFAVDTGANLMGDTVWMTCVRVRSVTTTTHYYALDVFHELFKVESTDAD